MVSAKVLCVFLTFIRYYYHDSQYSTTKLSSYRTPIFASANTIWCMVSVISVKQNQCFS